MTAQGAHPGVAPGADAGPAPGSPPSIRGAAAGEAGQKAGDGEQGTGEHEGTAGVGNGTQPPPGGIPWDDIWDFLRRAARGGHSANFHGSVQFRDLNLGDRGAEGRTATEVGDVPEELLRKVRAVYAPPSCDPAPRAALAERNLAILSAPDGAGRFCAALSMLSGLDGLDDRGAGAPPIQLVVISAGELHEICTREYARGCREVVVVDAASAAGLGWPALESLCHRLRALQAHVVVSLDAGVALPPQARQVVAFEWHVDVDNGTLLRSHLDWYLGGHELVRDPADLVRAERVSLLLSERLLPRELDRLAWLLAEVARGRASLEEALGQFGREVEREVADWFEGSPRLDEYTLIIALATLEGCAAPGILGAARRLEEMLARSAPERDAMSAITHGPLGRRLEKVRARSAHRVAHTEFGPVQEEILVATSSEWSRAVLRNVWRHHDAVRPELLTWWRELAAGPSVEVQVSVAAALTAVCELGFPELLRELLTPWARDAAPRVRLIAAVVLARAACEEGEAGQQARRLLRHWSTLRDQHALRWTAALAYGSVGAVHPTVALQALTAMAASAGPDLLEIVTHALAMLFDAEGPDGADDGESGRRVEVRTVVLEVLLDWSGQRPPLRTLALRSFVLLAGRRESEEPQEGAAWPRMLRLLDGTPASYDTALELWLEALDHAPVRRMALDALMEWVALGDEDRELLAVVGGFLRALAAAPPSHNGPRIRYQLQRRASGGGRGAASARSLLAQFGG